MNLEAKPPAGSGNLDRQRLRAWLQMLSATRHVEMAVRSRLRDSFDITLPQFDVLAALHRAEKGLTMTALSRDLRVSNGNVTGIVDRLVEDGILVRIPVDNDRRATTVRLTKAGREQFEAMAISHEAWIDTLLDGIDVSEVQHLSEQLECIARKSTKGED